MVTELEDIQSKLSDLVVRLDKYMNEIDDHEVACLIGLALTTILKANLHLWCVKELENGT